MPPNGTHLLQVTWEGFTLVHRCLQCGERAPAPEMAADKVPWSSWDKWLDTCPGTKGSTDGASCV